MTIYRFDSSRIGQGWTLKRDGRPLGILFDHSTADERATVIAALNERASTHGQPRGA